LYTFWLAGWLILVVDLSWLAGWLAAGWLVGWLAGWLAAAAYCLGRQAGASLHGDVARRRRRGQHAAWLLCGVALKMEDIASIAMYRMIIDWGMFDFSSSLATFLGLNRCLVSKL
jgi:hypothetical protein